jgi:hypothetical protein
MLAIGFYVLLLALVNIYATRSTVLVFAGVTFETTGDILIFPFLFQLLDMIHEHFGTKVARKAVWITIATQVVLSLLNAMSVLLPAGTWGADQATWGGIFGSTWGIVLASLLTLAISNNMDVWFFAALKKRTKSLWIRNALSDVPGLTIDAFVFLLISAITAPFLIPFEMWGIYLLTTLVFRWFLGIIDTPLMYFHRWFIERRDHSLDVHRMGEIR